MRPTVQVEDLVAQGVVPPGWVPPGWVLAPRQRYADFWYHVLAAIIDQILKTAVALGLWVLSALMIGDAVAGIFVEVLWLAYVVGLDAGGGTLGKRAVSIRGVDATDHPPGALRSAVRHVPDLAWALYFTVPSVVLAFVEPSPVLIAGFLFSSLAMLGLGFVALVDVLWMLFDDDKQTLHDKLAGTYVVRA